MQVASNKLTPGEIQTVVEKIRRKYDQYVGTYHKPKAIRKAFEDRYISALRSNVDISSFLLAEISAVDELLKREEAKKEAAREEKPRAEAKKDHADKVVEENLKRIEKYPDFPLHKDAGIEVRRLLGALDILEKEHWRRITGALRNTAYSINSVEMLSLDSRLRSVALADKDGVPALLVRYIAQLRRFPRSHSAIERVEKEYILEVAFLLHDLFVILERVKRVYLDLGEEATKVLDGELSYIWGIITDFRLKEFRRKGPDLKK